MMEQVGNVIFHVVLVAVMLFGLLGLIIPVLPGLVIIWLAVLVYALATGFSWANGLVFAVMTVMMVVGNLIDNLFMAGSARSTGASWVGILVALVAGLIASIFLTPIGGLAFALLGLFAVEWIRLKQWRKALESTKSMAIGCGWSAVIRFGIGVVMILLWVVWAIWM
jgi:uncharacterized protein YqgC (DUF456 family)